MRVYFSYFCFKTYIVGTRYSCIGGAVLTCTYSQCFEQMLKKSIFSSPELLGSQGDLITHAPSSVSCRPQCSNIFLSETAGSVKAQLHVKPPKDGGTKFCINFTCHMTQIVAMAITNKKPLKYSSQEPKGL